MVKAITGHKYLRSLFFILQVDIKFQTQFCFHLIFTLLRSMRYFSVCWSFLTEFSRLRSFLFKNKIEKESLKIVIFLEPIKLGLWEHEEFMRF